MFVDEITNVFRLNMLDIKQMAGKTNTHHALGSARTVAKRRPQLAMSGGRPSPKNDNVLSRPRRPARLSGRAVRKGCRAWGRA